MATNTDNAKKNQETQQVKNLAILNYILVKQKLSWKDAGAMMKTSEEKQGISPQMMHYHKKKDDMEISKLQKIIKTISGKDLIISLKNKKQIEQNTPQDNSQDLNNNKNTSEIKTDNIIIMIDGVEVDINNLNNIDYPSTQSDTFLHNSIKRNAKLKFIAEAILNSGIAITTFCKTSKIEYRSIQHWFDTDTINISKLKIIAEHLDMQVVFELK